MPCVEAQTRLSIKNILLGTVFSEPSPAILSYTVGFARRYGSTMSLTGAVSPRAICEIIRNLQVDLAVIGTATQELRKADLDSATEEILSTVPCPVLIIGPRVTQMELAEGELERILYVTDFTTSSLDGVPYALALAQDHDAQLRFVHVAEETTMGPFHFGNSCGFSKTARERGCIRKGSPAGIGICCSRGRSGGRIGPDCIQPPCEFDCNECRRESTATVVAHC